MLLTRSSARLIIIVSRKIGEAANRRAFGVGEPSIREGAFINHHIEEHVAAPTASLIRSRNI
jgi:hypothetical protein